MSSTERMQRLKARRKLGKIVRTAIRPDSFKGGSILERTERQCEICTTRLNRPRKFKICKRCEG